MQSSALNHLRLFDRYPLEGHSRTTSVVTGAGRAVVASAVSKAALVQPQGKFVASESHHQPEGNRVLSVPRRVYFGRGVRSSQRAIGSNIYRGPDMADEQVRSQRGDLGSPCLRSGSSWVHFWDGSADSRERRVMQ